MKTALRFPKAPSMEGTWMPVFLEPIVGSGERIAVAIACTAANAQALAIKIVPDNAIRCMYGTSAEKVSSLVDWIVQSLSEHISVEHSLVGWSPPFDGAMAGPISLGQGDDLREIISQAASMVSSLSKPPDLLAVDPDSEMIVHDDRWETQIQVAVSSQSPSLAQSFGVTQDLGKANAKIKFGFMTAKYAANFGLMLPDHLPHSLGRSKIKLLDLELLKDARLLVKPSTIELILRTPRFDDKSISHLLLRRVIDNFEQIESHANGQGIGVVRAESAEEAAEYLLKVA